MFCKNTGSRKVTLLMPYSTCFGSSIVSQDVSKKGHKLVPSRKLTAKAPENQWFEDGPFLVGVWAYFQGRLLLVSGVVYLQQKSEPDAGSRRRIAFQPSGHVIAMSRRTRYSWNFHHKWFISSNPIHSWKLTWLTGKFYVSIGNASSNGRCSIVSFRG